MPEPSPEQRFEDLVDEFTGLDGVTPPMPGPRRFGSNALRANGASSPCSSAAAWW